MPRTPKKTEVTRTMAARIIDGKETARLIRSEIAAECRTLASRGIVPGLAVVIVGDDPASKVYVRNKRNACLEVGFYSEVIEMPADTKMEELRAVIERLNTDTKIHGILVQLPLPKGLDEREVIGMIDPRKDVDAFHPVNVGLIMSGGYRMLPCTPAGVMELLRRYSISIEGRECVVVGRSNIVGKPMAMLLLEANGTVTICHSRTTDLAGFCRRADILVVAVGSPAIIKADMVKPGAVVIDVGINRLTSGGLSGDVDFAGVSNVASYITPVPGGVGPMTIAMLLKNTLNATKLANGI